MNFFSITAYFMIAALLQPLVMDFGYIIAVQKQILPLEFPAKSNAVAEYYT